MRNQSMKWLMYLFLLFPYDVTSQQHDIAVRFLKHDEPEESNHPGKGGHDHNEKNHNNNNNLSTIENGSTNTNNERSQGTDEESQKQSYVQVLSENEEKEKNDTKDEKAYYYEEEKYEIEEHSDEHEESVPEDDDSSMPPDDPEKINTEEEASDCETWLERADEFINGDYDAFSRLCGESANGNSSVFGEEIVPDLAVGNFFRFSVFMTLPPNWQSTGNTLDDALTAVLNSSFPQYRIMTDHAEYSWGTPSKTIEADIMSYKVKPNAVRKEEDKWWWQYSFKYFCYVPGTTDPIDSETGKQAFEDIMNWIETAESKLKSISGFADHMQGITYDVQMDPPKPCDECVYMSPCYGHDCELSPTYAPPAAPEFGSASLFPTFSPTLTSSNGPSLLRGAPQFGSMPGEIALDPTAWDWRRYTGLALLLTTVMGTLCLSQTARLRNAARDRKEDWGNLATEEGVDELLRTGWKVRGSLMEIYDRKNVGYRDSDSMLIGGYEERVPVGSEIAVSRTQSETVGGTAQS